VSSHARQPIAVVHRKSLPPDGQILSFDATALPRSYRAAKGFAMTAGAAIRPQPSEQVDVTRKDAIVTTYFGTPGNDSITGSSSPDILYGYPEDTFPENEFGNDTLRGGGGNDDIYGGGGNDTLLGDDGGDDLYGGDGDDILHGGRGNDHFDGGAGNDIFVVLDDLQDTFRGGLGTDSIRLEDFVSYQRLILNTEASVETLDMSAFALSGTQYGDEFDFSGVASIIHGATAIDLGTGDDKFIGHDGADFVNAGNGDDQLDGGGGNDMFSGGDGADTFDGGAGDDIFLIAGNDTDVFLGGEGVDTVRLDDAATRYRLILDSAAGVELLDRAGNALNGTSAADIFDLSGLTQFRNSGPEINLASADDLYVGYIGSDKVAGGGGNDTLRTGGGNDTLDGGVGADQLEGGDDNDKLIGGLGSDDIYGGAGKDIFVLETIKDSRVSMAGRDTIFDFSNADRIDLREIDAKVGRLNNDTFTFIGTDTFSKTAGELRFENKALDTYIYGDVTGDGKADFAIHLDDLASLTKGDFLL
jgi:Ca2+-binding RTX toxin-like protein